MKPMVDALHAAVGAGILSAAQAERLGPFLDGQGAFLPHTALPSAEDGQIAEESEQPRFLRGFHDILITIGVLIVLAGASGLAGPFASFPLIVVLAEILIRRQRLALPAVALTLALLYVTVAVSRSFVPRLWFPDDSLAVTLAVLSPVPVVMALFYTSTRVPLAFALAVVSAAGCLVLGILILIGKGLGADTLLTTHSTLVSGICMVIALGLFVLAMRYDIADPMRRTRRSDIAFWLHLVTAPALLYAMLSLVLLGQLGAPVFKMPAGYAAIVIVVVAGFMIVGLVIDRRAFVTSGLVSLGFAIFALVRNSGFDGASYGFSTIFAVGVVVLGIGIFWTRLRRLIMRVMPASIADRLHPAL